MNLTVMLLFLPFTSKRSVVNLTKLSLKHSQKEKEVKIHRRQLEKKWREELNQLDQQREQEGHGKIDLGVSHALALGPPADDYVPGNSYE